MEVLFYMHPNTIHNDIDFSSMEIVLTVIIIIISVYMVLGCPHLC